MRKPLLLMLLLSVMSVAAYAQKFALIDMEYILKNIPAYESANQQMEQSSKQWQAEVEKLAGEAKAMYEDYQSTASKLTAAQRTQKEDAIVAKEKEVADLRRKYFGPEGEMAKLQARLMGPIQNDIYDAVKAIATEQGYAVVTDRASATSIIFASPDIDISNEVLAKLGYSN